MPIKRISRWVYPDKLKDIKSIQDYLQKHYTDHATESQLRVQDFDALQISNFPFVNVKAYGAKGNGVQNDSPYIQAAINSLTTGGIVYFPPGTYLLKASLTLSSYITLMGSGRSSTTLKCDTTLADYSIKATGTLGANKIGIVIQDLWINGDMKANPLGGISMSYCHGCDIHRVLVYGFDHASAVGFYAKNCYMMLYESCQSHLGVAGTPNGESGFKIEVSDVSPTELLFLNCKAQRSPKGFYFTGTPTSVNRIFSPLLIGCGVTENDYGYEIDTRLDGFTLIGGNQEKGGTYTPTYGVYIHPGTADYVRNVYIANIDVWNIPVFLKATNMTGLSIEHCTFTGSGSGGTVLDIDPATCTRVFYPDSNTNSVYYNTFNVAATLDPREHWEDLDFDNDEVITTGIRDTDDGLIMVSELIGHINGLYRIDDGALTAISAEATFDLTKDHAATYNLYFEDNLLKVQNKVGNNKKIVIEAQRAY
jgi:hypothetical protein